MMVLWRPYPGTLAREAHENENDGHHMMLRDDGWYECRQCETYIYRATGATVSPVRVMPPGRTGVTS